MIEKHTDIQLTNNEVKDILGTPPKWILRWGNFLLLLIMIILATGSIFIRRPEIVEGKIEIMPLKKEAVVFVPLHIIIDSVFVKDGATVTAGETLFTYIKAGNLYTVIAPVTGIASIQQLLSKNSIIDQDSNVVTISPANQEYAVKGLFPGASVSKIYPGQLLEININDYPKEEFGVLKATVITKPVLDSAGNALITIQLDNNTTTNHGKILPIETLARGTGYTEISNKRLIAWLISE